MNRPLTMTEVKRVCGVRGCGNGPQNGKRVFAIARMGELGPGMAIECEDCIKEAYGQVFPPKPTAAPDKKPEKAPVKQPEGREKKTGTKKDKA